MMARSADVLLRGTALPAHESIRLLMAATARSRSDVILGFDVTNAQARRFETFVDRRLSDEPLQYIEGTVPFGPVELIVDSRVLVPRPETEHMFESAVAAVDRPDVIVDLCCGSGNLALAMAATFPQAATYAVDISQAAAEVTALNAERNQLDVEILVGDLFDPLPDSLAGTIDLLITNPPYLAHHELESLPGDVLREPRVALRGGIHGDEIVARIAAGARRWLAPGGVVFCEVSEFDTDRFVNHFGDLGGVVHTDLSGSPRFVVGTKPVTASDSEVG
jgi:release factor glutamine methyltransferase